MCLCVCERLPTESMVVWCRIARTTYFLGQAALAGIGGDLVLDAGTGVTAGRMIIGAGALSVTIGAPGGTVTMPATLAVAGGCMCIAQGHVGLLTDTLLHDVVTVTGGVSATQLSVAGQLSAGSVSTAALTVGGNAFVAGMWITFCFSFQAYLILRCLY